MKRTILALAAALLCVAGQAQVTFDQVSYTVPMPSVETFAFLQEGDFGGGDSYPIIVPQFDPSLGQLVDVLVTFDIDIEVFADVFGEGILNTGVSHTVGWSLGQLAVGVAFDANATDPPTFRLLGDVSVGFGAGCVGNPGEGEACGDSVGTLFQFGFFEDSVADTILLSDFIGTGDYNNFQLIVDYFDSSFDLFNISTAFAELTAFSNSETDFTITYVYQTGMAVDTDSDGVTDDMDNCTLVANQDQMDEDGDGYGNACDADVNNDCVVNVIDLGALRAGFFSTDPLLDFNGDGVVNVTDLGIMRLSFFGTPGPSGIGGDCDFDQSSTGNAYRLDAEQKRYLDAR